nr:unnamed protein product [Naegleria fowleri]
MTISTCYATTTTTRSHSQLFTTSPSRTVHSPLTMKILFMSLLLVIFLFFISPSNVIHCISTSLRRQQDDHQHDIRKLNNNYYFENLQQDNNSYSVSQRNFGRFHQCVNYSSMAFFLPCLSCGDKIPDNFACLELIFPEKVERSIEWNWNSRNEFMYRSFSTSGENRNICSRVRKWEQVSKLNCHDVLCQSKDIIDLALKISNGETSIFDWFNYCKYCSKDYIFDLKTCHFNDDRFVDLRNNFPNLLLTCGATELGIPILVNSNTTGTIYGQTYETICYCTESDFFGYSCWYTAKQRTYYDFLSYLGLSLHAINFISIFFISFIPKFIYSLRLRRWRNIATMSLVLLCEASSIAGYITLIVGNSNLFIALEYCSLCIGYFSLIAWIKFWFHLVRFVKSKKYKSTWCSGICLLIVFLIFLALMLLWPILSMVIRMQIPTEFVVAMNFVLLLSILIAILTYIGLSCYIYFVMRKVSDIDLFQTWFLRFVFFSSAIITIMGVIHICMILFDFAYQDPTTGTLFFVAHVLLIILMVGVSYMEFEKSEFLEVYSCLCAYCRKKNSYLSILSEVNSEVNIASATVNEEEQTIHQNEDAQQILKKDPTV